MSDERGDEIVCRVRVRAAAAEVFALLSTDRGRAAFWAERTEQEGDEVVFHFPNGERLRSRVLASQPPRLYSLTYFDRTVVTFELRADGGGTDLHLRETGVPSDQLIENRAGWVSVLLALKARAEHGIDLRNHDPERTWSQGYVDN